VAYQGGWVDLKDVIMAERGAGISTWLSRVKMRRSSGTVSNGTPDIEGMEAARDVSGLTHLYVVSDSAGVRRATAAAITRLADPVCVELMFRGISEEGVSADRDDFLPLLLSFGANAAHVAADSFVVGDPRLKDLSRHLIEELGAVAVSPVLEVFLKQQPALPLDDAVALFECLGGSALPALAALLLEGWGDDRVVALLVHHGGAAVLPLLHVCGDDEDREPVVEVCRRIGLPAVAQLLTTAQRGAPALRPRATRMLSGIVDVALPTVIALATGSGNASQEQRIMAIGLLGRAPFVQVESTLVSLLGAPLHNVRRAAYEAFADAGDVAQPALVALACEPQNPARLAAIEALGYAHSPESAEIMIRLLDDGDAQVREAATAALVKFGPEVRESLSEALASGSYWVRSAVSEVLRQWSR
jgi:HEAT repeat protein